MAKTLLATATASRSTSVSFTSGIDSTYSAYEFHIRNLEPRYVDRYLLFQMDSGSGYATPIYSSNIRARSDESGGFALLEDRNTTYGQAGGTAYQAITDEIFSNYWDSAGGILTIYNPSSTTSVKHFTSQFTITGQSASDPETSHTFCSGYFDTTSALTRIDFMMSYQTIETARFAMYGVS